MKASLCILSLLLLMLALYDFSMVFTQSPLKKASFSSEAELIAQAQAFALKAKDKETPIKLIKNFDFVLIGDSRAQIDHLGPSELWLSLQPQIEAFFQSQGLTKVQAQELLYLHVGDLVKNGNAKEEWLRFLALKPKHLWAVQGNHDRGIYFQDYHPRLPLDTYLISSWLCVIGFNTEIPEDQAKALISEFQPSNTMLSTQKKQCLQAPFKIWLQHRPVYATGKHGNDELGWNHWLIPALTKLGVQWHFSGHDHHYERTVKHQIQFVVSGGATRFLQPHWLKKNKKQSIKSRAVIHFIALRLSIFTNNHAYLEAITVQPSQQNFHEIDRMSAWLKK